ncbi:MAG: diguanylate cyclase, partial [Gemmatimonadales bacterium]
QPRHYARIAGERRRFMSTPGGMPFPVLKEERQASRTFRKLRGFEHLERLRTAVVEHRLDLGFVDLLPCEGCLDHPLLGPPEELYWRRRLMEQTEPPRSALPVLDPSVHVRVGASYTVARNGHQAPEAEVDAVVRQIGLASNGQPWDCGACGYSTCRRFASAFLKGRAGFRQCPPYQERRAEEARREAAVDELTGLATYRVLRDRLTQELSRSRRSGDPFAVLFMDMDGFKRINDSHGHAAGSTVLAEVGRRLAEAVRATDTAARYGGDEFVVLLIRTDLTGAVHVAEVVRERLGGLGAALGYAATAVTASIGVATFNPETPEAADVLERADRALYRAKAAGGNQLATGD